MHRVYKQRWAATMQGLLGAPPPGDTADVIAAFEPIAEAPLDKDIPPDPRQLIQPVQRDLLLARDVTVAAYAAQLKAAGVDIDDPLAEPTAEAPTHWGFLTAWNRLSLDEAAANVRERALPPPLSGQEIAGLNDPAQQAQARQEVRISMLINDRDQAQARGKLLAFVRAQVLWNEYRMDSRFMLDLMKNPSQLAAAGGEPAAHTYQAPLDWRTVQSHALYWAMYGIHVCRSIRRADIDALNSDRYVLYALKDMTFYGRLTMIQNAYRLDYPELRPTSDLRFVGPTHRQFVQFIEAVDRTRGEKFEENTFRDGHRNYLINAIELLYAARRVDEDNHPVPALALGLITMALQTGFVDICRSDMGGYDHLRQFARDKVYLVYQRQAVARNKLPPFEEIARAILRSLLREPRDMGYEISQITLAARSRLYKTLLTDWPDLPPMVYDDVAPYLRAQCSDEGMSFDAAFPPPAGLEAWRARNQRTSAPVR
jgi:hypothetical protein